jgi:hypothetical protein
MLDLSPARKNKINLADYELQKDIENRILMSDFSTFDLQVLEDILYSPLKISIKKMARTLDCTEGDLGPILRKLQRGGLLQIDGDQLLIDKETRKYYEFQVERFSDAFRPDMEFIQGLLRKVPIQVLPAWYAIPRSSNNIFESIVEKYLITPQLFQRYLHELNFGEPVLTAVLNDVMNAPDLQVSSSDLIARYNLTRHDFEEIMLQLEFNFVACVSYLKEEDHFHEVVTPFYEWRQYLLFLKETDPKPIEEKEAIFRKRDSDFAFIEDMEAVLQIARRKPIPLDQWEKGSLLPISVVRELSFQLRLPIDTQEEEQGAQNYLSSLLEKMCLIKLGDRVDGKLYALESANDWLALGKEAKSSYLYRHSLNRLLTYPGSVTEKLQRDAEKSIKRILDGRWALFDDLFQGTIAPLKEDGALVLRKTGKSWSYAPPSHGEEERLLLHAVLFEGLFEAGILAVGTYKGRDCLAVTPFGSQVFAS